MLNNLKTALSTLRGKKPLVLNLTNYVTMDFMANALLALGAAPVMSVCNQELEELIKIAGAVNINIGTLNNESIERYRHASDIARQYKKPVVLDPVGAGASHIRTQTAKSLLPFATIIKGNASEIIALASDEQKTLGVESTHTTEQAIDIAKTLARHHQCNVVISGEKDIITNGYQEQHISAGHALMSRVTGMGCTLGAIIAAFNALSDQPFENSMLATLYFGLCGQLAGNKTRYPGSFRTTFIDTLYEADFKALATYCT